MYLLDTNHCSRILDRDPAVLAGLAAVGDTPIATCEIVRGELLFMAAFSDRHAANTGPVTALLRRFVVYPIDQDVAAWYSIIKADLLNHFGPRERSKRRRATIAQIGVGDNDLWIAATAKAHDATIVSADNDFTRIAQVTDLRVVSWLAPPA